MAPETNKVTLEHLETCPLCSSQQLEQQFKACDTLHHMPGEWEIFKCLECGYMLTNPRPDKDSIHHFYPADYSPFCSFAPSSTPPRWKKIGKKIYKSLMDDKELMVPHINQPGKVLEVGCATGRNLIPLHEQGWQTWGIEPSPDAVAQMKDHPSLSIKQGNIESVDYSTDFFDVIIVSMVLEHLHTPLQDLQKMHHWLTPGGCITGSVPNCGSWEFRKFNAEWFALQVPTHLSHFTPQTLRKILEGAGFVHIKIYHQRNLHNLMIQLGRFLKKKELPLANFFISFPERAPWWARIAARLLSAPLAWASQSGRISFTAQKAND